MKRTLLVGVIITAIALSASATPNRTASRIGFQHQTFMGDTVIVSLKTMQSYVGDYYLSTAPNRIITVFVHDNFLCGKFSPTESVVMTPMSQSKWDFKTVSPKANAEFIVENGVVKKMVIMQGGGKFDWIKKS